MEEAKVERRKRREECDRKPVIYNWLVSRSGEENTEVKKIESIISPSTLPVVGQ